MVSKASEDFPLPLGPVTTVSFPSGRSRSMPLRLFWRAPRISMHPCSAGALTLSFSPFLEPTGDNRFTRCGLQIFRGKYGRSSAAQDGIAAPPTPVILGASEGPHDNCTDHTSYLVSSVHIGEVPRSSPRLGMTVRKL